MSHAARQVDMNDALRFGFEVVVFLQLAAGSAELKEVGQRQSQAADGAHGEHVPTAETVPCTGHCQFSGCGYLKNESPLAAEALRTQRRKSSGRRAARRAASEMWCRREACFVGGTQTGGNAERGPQA